VSSSVASISTAALFNTTCASHESNGVRKSTTVYAELLYACYWANVYLFKDKTGTAKPRADPCLPLVKFTCLLILMTIKDKLR